MSAVTVSGEPDAVLRVQVDDIRHLERVIEALRRQPNIVRTRTMIVLSVLVDRPDGAARVACRPRTARRSTSFAVRLLVAPRRRGAGALGAGARRPATASGWSTPSTTPRRWSAPPRSGRRPACCSCSTATTATARRSRAGSACRTCELPEAVPGSPFEVVRVAATSRAGTRSRSGGRSGPRARRAPRRSARTPYYALGAAGRACTRCCAPSPPGALRGYPPEHLLVGHGRGGPRPAAPPRRSSAAYARLAPRPAAAARGRAPELVAAARSSALTRAARDAARAGRRPRRRRGGRRRGRAGRR